MYQFWESALETAGKVLVTGGGGFIGGHLVADLLPAGHSDIRVVDCKPLSEWHQLFPQVENARADLRQLNAWALLHTTPVINLAADMGGMGFIETHKAECMLSVYHRHELAAAAEDMALHRRDHRLAHQPRRHLEFELRPDAPAP